MTATDMNEQLHDEWHGLLFGARRSIRYNMRRRAFFECAHNIAKTLAISAALALAIVAPTAEAETSHIVEYATRELKILATSEDNASRAVYLFTTSDEVVIENLRLMANSVDLNDTTAPTDIVVAAALARSALALRYTLGIGVIPDDAQAHQNWRVLAEQGSQSALHAMVLMRAQGKGLPPETTAERAMQDFVWASVATAIGTQDGGIYHADRSAPRALLDSYESALTPTQKERATLEAERILRGIQERKRQREGKTP